MRTEYKAEIRKMRLILAPYKTIKRPIKKSALKRAMICAISFVVGPFKCRAPNIDTPPENSPRSREVPHDPT